ncbi:metallophosphoesterase family protein [Antrihabitans spumae]|uniref:Metallophosphoesterase family protein n=1 Tax=Antrihabitans spumae TaxID=3373370 RepID=A0ABW7JJX6_9NOCA
MSCCGPSRRRLLTMMAAGVVLPMVIPGRSGSAGADPIPLLATDLEVVTVTDTSVVVTWSTVSPQGSDAFGRPLPVAANTELRIGPADSVTAPKVLGFDDTPTGYHYAEVHGLEPGREYRFEAYSNGVRAVPTNGVTIAPGAVEQSGRFTTLVPPPGRHLRTIALSNDVHYGEEVSGIVSGDLPPGYRQDQGLPPYPEVMLSAMLDDLRSPDRGADQLILAGDLTAEATAVDSAAVRARLDAWGSLGSDYFVCRGNHDRPHVGAEYAQCSAVPAAPDHHDCWGDSFVDHQKLLSYQVGGLRLLGIDTTALDASGGTIDQEQMAEIRAALSSDPDRPTVVFGHHPVTNEAAMNNAAGPGFVLDRGNAAELQDGYVGAPGVFLHHSGHTHRNKVTRPDVAARVEFLEVGAVKEYPGGYSLLRVYDGGYMVNFYKTRSDLAKRWSARTRGQYFGLFPEYALGTFAERNHVVARDLSGLTSS